MKPIYELVTAAELNAGDQYHVDANLPTIESDRIMKVGGIVTVYRSTEHKLLNPISIPSHLKVFRRLPATDDPRVLRRAAEFLAAYYANTTTNPDCDGELQDAIELARTELEELARNGIDEA